MVFSGQLSQIAQEIFDLKLQTNVLNEETVVISGSDITIVNFRLNFDNSAYVSQNGVFLALIVVNEMKNPFVI